MAVRDSAVTVLEGLMHNLGKICGSVAKAVDWSKESMAEACKIVAPFALDPEKLVAESAENLCSGAPAYASFLAKASVLRSIVNSCSKLRESSPDLSRPSGSNRLDEMFDDLIGDDYDFLIAEGERDTLVLSKAEAVVRYFRKKSF